MIAGRTVSDVAYSHKEFNFSRITLEYSTNVLVNSDFCLLITCINNRDYFKIGETITGLENKTKAFYSPDMKKELLLLLKSFLVIRRYIQRRYINKSTARRVNELSLSLSPIKPEKSIELYINNIIYVFDINELLKIYKYSLYSIDSNLYLNATLNSPKNPYTNIVFTLKEKIILYNKFKDYYISIGRSFPVYLEKFKGVYFDIDLYLRYNFDSLMLKSVSAYIQDLSKKQFDSEFKIMIDSSFSSRNSYCKYCYKKRDLRELFSKTLKLYILNSNNIFIFGNYTREFCEIAEKNNLYFDKGHIKLHRRRLRASNLRSFNSIINSNPIPLLQDHVLYI